MTRTATLLITLFAATPALAGAPHFQAQPVAKPAEAQLALRDTLWRCGEAGCGAGESSSRPAVVCAVLAREVGTLRSFAVKGQALAADELAKCNARAKRSAPDAVRTAAAE